MPSSRNVKFRPAVTEAAKAARQAYFCDLCQKGYNDMAAFNTHLSSYDHAHTQRLKDMKAMVRKPNPSFSPSAAAGGTLDVPNAAAAARPVAAVSQPKTLGSAGGGAGFRKGTFKTFGFKPAFVPVGGKNAEEGQGDNRKIVAAMAAAPVAAAPVAVASVAAVPVAAAPVAVAPVAAVPVAAATSDSSKADVCEDGPGSDSEDEDYEVYDPRHPTD